MNTGTPDPRQLKIADSIQSLGSGFTSLSLIAIGSQAVWPVPGFVLPQWVLKAAFGSAMLGFAVRTMANPIAGFIVLFMPTPQPTTTEVKP
jgi:hypothetical protein